MRRERSADLLQDILDFIDRIESWTPAEAAVDADEKTLYAVLHALQYIGEAVSRLPELRAAVETILRRLTKG